MKRKEWMTRYIYTDDPKGDLEKLNNLPRCEAYFDEQVPSIKRFQKLMDELCLAGLKPTMDEDKMVEFAEILWRGLNPPAEMAKWPKSTLCEGILIAMEDNRAATVCEFSRLDVLFVLASAIGFNFTLE